MISGVLSVIGIGLIYAAAAAQNLTHAFVPRRTLDEHVALIAPSVTILLPEDRSAPVPTIIFFHGCGGQRPMHMDHAEAIADAGFGVLVVNSFAPRGIGRFEAMTQVCAALRLWGQERSADVFAAMEIARQTDGVDPDRLVLAGWSHGGWTLLDAMSFASEEIRPPTLTSGAINFDGVDRIIPIYPYCGFPARGSGHIGPGLPAVEMILAERDMIAPHGDCERLARRAESAGAAIDYAIWPGVTHAFDDTDAPALDPRMDFDAEAAARLRDQLIAALQRTQD
jgi:dienelactone hydrolase